MNSSTEMPEAETPAAVAKPLDRIGARFISAGLLDAGQVERVVAFQQAEGLRFGEAAVRLGFLTERDVQAVLSEQFNYATAREAEAVDASLAIAHDPFGREAEAIREIRAELMIRLHGLAPASIAVISPNEGEGKSYLAASLAIAFSQSGQRTLLVNANLRASGKRQLFNLQGPAPGLSTMLARRSEAAPGQPVPGFPLLRVLAAGPQPPNPTEILNAPALRDLLAGFASEIDVFVVDTPAAIASSDAQIIARQTDICLLVGRQHRTRLDDLRLVHERLRSAGAQVAGTVYNSFGESAMAPGRAAGRARPR